MTGSVCIVVFRVYDKDRDGRISRDDLTQVSMWVVMGCLVGLSGMHYAGIVLNGWHEHTEGPVELYSEEDDEGG